MTNEQKITQLLADELGIKENEIAPEKHLTTDLGMDSLDRVEMLMKLEKAFDVSIPDEDAENINTVQDVFDYINKLTLPPLPS